MNMGNGMSSGGESVVVPANMTNSTTDVLLLLDLPYVPLNPYNGTIPTGGDSLKEDLNSFYQSGDIAWMLMCTALVLLQTPGIGLFYSGLVRRKSALSLVFISLMTIAITSFQWFFWGYSLTFSHGAGKYIGNLDNVGFMNVLAQPSLMSGRIPDILMAIYQGMFACLTNTIAIGAIAERGRLLPAFVFVFIWSTIIYDPIACWVWNPHGWASVLGAYDFAGGTPVHIASGAAALAYALVLGKRKGHGTEKLSFRPHNTTQIAIGTVLLWVGWFGFNAGSAMSASLRAVVAAVNTHLAACMGGIAWCMMDWRHEQKWSLVGFCSGVVAGLVCITPGAGFVPPWASILFGIFAGVACNAATKLKFIFRADDVLDIFAVHAVAGWIGNVMTGLFAANYIAALDGSTVIAGGWLNHHWVQLGYQIAMSIAGLVYSFFGTAIILLIMDRIPSLQLRATEDAEEMGLDEAEMGEFAYDYVELARNVEGSRSRQGSRAGVNDSEHLRRLLHGRPISQDIESGSGKKMDMRQFLHQHPTGN